MYAIQNMMVTFTDFVNAHVMIELQDILLDEIILN